MYRYSPMVPNELHTNTRISSLDALRGYAILTMVLSGTIAFGILPDWMYHAQTPPPTNRFDPSVLGITWVDLVFPFFLFAMGAAFPFSIGKKAEEGVPAWKLVFDSLTRGLKLAFFAIFIQHMYPHVISKPQDYTAWFTSLASFVVMFPLFMRFPWKMSRWVHYAIRIAALSIAVTLLLTTNYANDREFSLSFSNIIILVLANMAVFASIAYIFTSKNKWKRLIILPFVMAILLGGTSNADSWNSWLYNFTPAPWLYSFRFLKYLFIVIPGSIAGDYLLEYIKNYTPTNPDSVKRERQTAYYLVFLALGIILLNLYCLFTRCLVVNLFGSFMLLSLGYYLVSRLKTANIQLWKNLFIAGACFLMLGLFFEAYEDGIRKDHSTYSYYLVSSGLAFMALMIFSIVCDYFKCKKSTSFLSMAGQNPMIAYVSSSLVVLPILNITHLLPFLDAYGDNALWGFLRGVVITALVTLITVFFTKKKWFWRT